MSQCRCTAQDSVSQRAPCLLGELKGDLKKERTSKRAGGEAFVGTHQAEVGGSEGRKLCSSQRDRRVQSLAGKEQSACVPVCDSVCFWAWGALSDFVIHSKHGIDPSSISDMKKT